MNESTTPAKRLKTSDSQHLPATRLPFDIIPDSCVKDILRLVGKGHFIFVATVNERFERCYEEVLLELDRGTCDNNNDTTAARAADQQVVEGSNRIPDPWITSARSVTESVSRAKWFFEYVGWGSTTNRFLDKRNRRFYKFRCLDYGEEHKDYDVKMTSADFIRDMATLHGNLDVLQWSLQQKGSTGLRKEPDDNCTMSDDFPVCKRSKTSCAMAALSGNVAMLRWLRAQDCYWDSYTLQNAGLSGDLEMLVWAFEHGCPDRRDVDICSDIALGGHLPLLQWARQHGFSWNKETCYQAARGGHLEMLVWAKTNGCKWDVQTNLAAARSGSLEVLKSVLAMGCEIDRFSSFCAAQAGSLEMLKWVHLNGDVFEKVGICRSATQVGNLEMLKWARLHDCPYDREVCSNAAENGNVDVLAWAIADGCSCDERTCTVAAKRGDLAMLMIARENGCPWDEDTCLVAAENGHLELLLWALAHGCPCDWQACYYEELWNYHDNVSSCF